MEYFRNDGTWSDTRVSIDWASSRKERLCYDFKGIRVPTLSEAYQRYGTCHTLTASSTSPFPFTSLDPIYRFLYGKPVEEFLLPDDCWSPLDTRFTDGETQTWTSETVASMDWNMFCLSYYAFLCSQNGLSSGIWDALKSIFVILRNSPEMLPAIWKNQGYQPDGSLQEFWQTVSLGLQVKLISHLNDSHCYIAYSMLEALESYLPEPEYAALERKCCKAFDEIARNKVDRLFCKPFDSTDWPSLKLEQLFFFNQYFLLPSAKLETEDYVHNRFLALLQQKGAEAIGHNKFIAADEIYAHALSYARSASENELFTAMRLQIAPLVIRAKDAKAEKQIKVEKQEKRRAVAQRLADFCTDAMVGLFFVSIISTVVFGILWWAGIFKLAKTFFILSGCILLCYVPVLITGARDRRRERPQP